MTDIKDVRQENNDLTIRARDTILNASCEKATDVLSLCSNTVKDADYVFAALTNHQGST